MIKIYWHQEVVDLLLLIKLLEILMHLSPGAAISLDMNYSIQEIVNFIWCIHIPAEFLLESLCSSGYVNSP
jgi:hypothetical protein